MYCRNCGTEIDEQDVFCSACGLKNDGIGMPQPASFGVSAEQAFDTMYRMFKYERLAWKIFGIVFTAFSGVWALLSALYTILGIVLATEEPLSAPPLFFCAAMFGLYILLFASMGIFGLVMHKRAERYMHEMKTDIRPAIVRATSVGMIVLGAMFSSIAMVFIIINFATAKANAPVLEQIAQQQQKQSS